MNYKNDPLVITARFGKCANCFKNVQGSQVYYFPATRSVYCLDCGESDYHYFLASKQDEELYNSQYGQTRSY